MFLRAIALVDWWVGQSVGWWGGWVVGGWLAKQWTNFVYNLKA